jgi:NTP pyrophosphatase (non-canonical NTP hydrolase)
MENFNFNTYQKWTKESAIYPHSKAFYYLMTGLASEVGEVLGKFKKEIRDGVDHSEGIKSELGDVLWYVARIADEYGWTLEEVARLNRAKIEDRRIRSVLSGDGDDR